MIDAQDGDVFDISIRATYHNTSETDGSHCFLVELDDGGTEELWLPDKAAGAKLVPVMPDDLSRFVAGSVWTSARLNDLHLMVVGADVPGRRSMVPSSSGGAISLDTAWRLYGPLRRAFQPAPQPPAQPVDLGIPEGSEIFALGSELPGKRIQAVRRQDHIDRSVDVVFTRTPTNQWVAEGRDGNGQHYGWQQLNGVADGSALVECEPPTE
jgi:hypothetical protein